MLIFAYNTQLCYTGCQLRLDKLENEPFSEFGLKSWKMIGFSPALAGKAGILFLDKKLSYREIVQRKDCSISHRTC